jgi:hypothetical protein
MSSPFQSTSSGRNVGRPRLHNEASPDDIGDRYQQAEFYTRASDTRGHSHSYRTAVPKDWAGVVARVVEHHSVYENAADFVRDAIFHRLVWLGRHEREVETSVEIQRVMLQAEMAKQDQVRVANELTIEHAETQLRGFQNCGDWVGLNQQLGVLRRWAALVPDPYRRRAEKIVEHYETRSEPF